MSDEKIKHDSSQGPMESQNSSLPDSDALVRVGKRLYLCNGPGMAEENIQAFRLFLQAAEAGHAEAQHWVCKCYINGSGVEKDLIAFLEWREKAANSGSADAQYALGDNYYHARLLVEQDYAVAVKWWLLAAEQGHVLAQNDLGYCFKYGKGVPQDHAEAVKWFTKSAMQGSAAAQFNLGHSYGAGLGVPQNYLEAEKWIRKSAQAGDTVAQKNMGLLYREGHGVPRDNTQALMWYWYAADNGNSNAQQEATAIAASLSTGDLEKAIHFYEEFRAKFPDGRSPT